MIRKYSEFLSKFTIVLAMLFLGSLNDGFAQNQVAKESCKFDHIPELSEDRYTLSGLEQKWLVARDVWSRSQTLIKTQQDVLNQAISTASNLAEERPRLERRLRSVEERISELDEIEAQVKKLEARKTELETDTDANQEDIDQIEREIKFNQDALDDKVRFEKETQKIKEDIASLATEVQDAKLVVKDAETCLTYLRNQYNRSEDKIKDLLTPESQRSDFKLYLSMLYAGIVFSLIAGFYFIASKDVVVRQTIFSQHVGIQFITLFSLVIAIILFGILDILGAKELSALLGGISGYILGRTTSDSADADKKGKPAKASISGKNISFTAPNAVSDAGQRFAALNIGDKIRIEGSQSNDGDFTVRQISAGTVKLEEKNIIDEKAGNVVKIVTV